VLQGAHAATLQQQILGQEQQAARRVVQAAASASPERMPSDNASPSACMDPCRMARLPPPKKPPGPGLNSPAGAPAAVGVAMPECGEATPLKAA
jgi:hypothetical protein